MILCSRDCTQHYVGSINNGTVCQELERVKKLLEARETKMVEMSREVIQLSETNQELQRFAQYNALTCRKFLCMCKGECIM